MSINQVARHLFQLAKSGDKKAFLEYIDKNKIYSKVPSMTGTDVSHFIYSFSILKISNQQIWKSLESIFLSKENLMGTQDIAFCASAFGKATKSPEIWEKVENFVSSRLNDISSSKDIVMIFYGAALAGYDSPHLWLDLEMLCLKTLFNLNQKELAMMIWSFCKVHKGTSKFWDNLEKNFQSQIQFIHIQNLSIILYSFSKMNKGESKFWEVAEIAVIKSLNKVGDRAKPQDIANLAWGFANMGKGSEVFWLQVEKISRKNLNKFSLLDVCNTAWSLISSKKKFPEFWPAFYSYIRNIDNIEEKHNQDLIMIIETLTQVKCVDQQIWAKLGGFFQNFMKKGLMDNLMYKASWHKNIFETNPQIWNEEIEDIYIRSIQKHLEDNYFLAIQNLHNICLASFPRFGSDRFLEKILECFIKIIEDPNLIKDKSAMLMVSKLIYILSVRFIFDNEKTFNLLIKFNETIDNFYRNQDNFLAMVKDKKGFIYQLKGVVHNQNTTHQRIFWSQLRKYKDLFSFEKQDIELLIFAIIVKNKLFFERKQHMNLKGNIERYYNKFGENGVDELTQVLFNLLLNQYKNTFVYDEFQSNSLLKELDIASFLINADSERQHDIQENIQVSQQQIFESI